MLSRFFRRQSVVPPIPSRRLSFKPRLEVLEDRLLPAVLFEKPLDLGAPAFGHGAQSRPGAQKIAEDFVLTAPGAADGITFYGTFFDNSGNTGTFDIMFFNDSAGRPSATPFYTFSTGAIAGVHVGTDEGRPIYGWSVLLPTVNFPNPSTYWVSVSGRPDWAWEHSLSNGDNTVYFRYFFTDAWTPGNSSPGRDTQAFQLAAKTADIAMQSAQLVSGNTVQFTYETTGNPGPFQVGLYRSANGVTYDPADLIATKTETPNPSGGTATGTIALPSPWTPDPTKPYLIVVADPSNAISEAHEDNNSKEIALPDLTATSFDYSITATSGRRITNDVIPIESEVLIVSTIQNQGIGVAGPAQVKLYISTDSTIDPTTDRLVDILDTLPELSAGADYQLVARVRLPETLPLDYFGKLWVGIVVDADHEVVESNEANNWNRAGIDAREAQLYDPITTPTTLTFSSRSAAIRYLTSNGFRAPLPGFLDGLLDSGWSKEVGAHYSRFNGQVMPEGAFRIQSSGPVYNPTTGMWELYVEGPEPNPRKALQLSFTFGIEWFLYVQRYHLEID